MGNRGLDPNFKMAIDILAHLVKSCITKGMLEEPGENKFSETVLILPYDDIKFFITKQGFTTGFL